MEQREIFKASNEELVALAIEDKKKDAVYQAKIDEYAMKKDAMEKLRRDKEESKFLEKQMTRQRLIDSQAAHLASIKNREDEILNKQVAEAEEKANNLFEEQQRRRMEMKDQMEKSRQQQIEKREREKAMTKEEQRQFSEFWKIRNEELQIADQQEKEEDRMRKEELMGYHKRQIDKKTKKVEDDFRLEQEHSTKTQALLDQNEK